MNGKKVFISYSWSNPAHELWVLQLAQRLVHDGVDVVLDKWNLKEGHDKYAFMESMVHATDIDKVLIILDQAYCEKANDRAGGVGTETTIISAKVYVSATQEKFIPIVAQRDEDSNAYLPVYLEGKIYIDLSEEEHFELNYEKLLRNIYQLPLLSKPELGSPPKYLSEESPISYKTTIIARGFEVQVEKNPKRLNSIVRDFLDEFFNNLGNFSIPLGSCTKPGFGTLLYDNLNKYKPLRDDYIDFMMVLNKHEAAVDMDVLSHFFERLPNLLYPSTSMSSWYDGDFNNYKFIINELFIYSIAIALKKENYRLLAHLLHTRYFIEDRYRDGNEPKTFEAFNMDAEGLEQHYISLGEKKVNAQADFLIKRTHHALTKADLTDADILCGFIADLENWRWFPKTYIYKSEDTRVFPIFNRLLSNRHFEKVKSVFDVDTIEELKIKFQTLKNRNQNSRGYSNSWTRMPKIDQYIEAAKIGTLR